MFCLSQSAGVQIVHPQVIAETLLQIRMLAAIGVHVEAVDCLTALAHAVGDKMLQISVHIVAKLGHQVGVVSTVVVVIIHIGVVFAAVPGVVRVALGGAAGFAGGGFSFYLRFWYCLFDVCSAYRNVAGYDYGYVFLYSGGYFKGSGRSLFRGASEQSSASLKLNYLGIRECSFRRTFLFVYLGKIVE